MAAEEGERRRDGGAEPADAGGVGGDEGGAEEEENGDYDARYTLLPLGETAAAVRGENELWLGLALQSPALALLTPAELSAVVSILLSAEMRKDSSCRFPPSEKVWEVVESLEAPLEKVYALQEEHGFSAPLALQADLAGAVEMWCDGCSWQEVSDAVSLDDGDLSRLLRRTLDLLMQIPQLPGVDDATKKAAAKAARMINRVPLSE